ncbi:MAG: CBS domain-containing protein [Acidobacteriota bacterium]
MALLYMTGYANEAARAQPRAIALSASSGAIASRPDLGGPGCYNVFAWRGVMGAEESIRTEKLRYLRLAEPTCMPPDTPLNQALDMMRKNRAACALVCSGEHKLLGILTERDVLHKVVGETIEGSIPVEQLMTATPRSLSPEDTLLQAIRLMTEGGYRHVPLTDKDGRLVGLVSAHDVITYIAEHFPAEVHNLPPRLHQKPTQPEGA